MIKIYLYFHEPDCAKELVQRLYNDYGSDNVEITFNQNLTSSINTWHGPSCERAKKRAAQAEMERLNEEETKPRSSLTGKIKL